MIYEYDAFIEVPEKLGEDKMTELDCAIANFVEDRFGFPVKFSILGQVDEKSGNCEIEKVVRCKDCKHMKYVIDKCKNGMCGVHSALIVMNGNDYCSYGERKEE